MIGHAWQSSCEGSKCAWHRGSPPHPRSDGCYQKQLVVRVPFTTENEHRIHLTHHPLPSFPRMGFQARMLTDSLGWMFLWKEVVESRQKLWGHVYLRSGNSTWHCHHLCVPRASSRFCLLFPLGVGPRHGALWRNYHVCLWKEAFTSLQRNTSWLQTINGVWCFHEVRWMELSVANRPVTRVINHMWHTRCQ